MTYKLLTKPELTDRYIRHVNLMRIVDGDTYEVYIKQGFKQGFEDKIRLNRLNTPEAVGPESPAGKYVVKQIEGWLGTENQLILHSVDWNIDRYGRVLGDLYKYDGENLNQWLLISGYAWPTDSNGSMTVDRDIRRLNLPKGIIDQVLINQR